MERRNSHHLPEAHHVDPNVSTANQVSALLHDFSDSQARDSEPGPSNMLLVFVHLRRLGLGKGDKILSAPRARPWRPSSVREFQTLARGQTHEQREVSGSVRLTVLRHNPLDVDVDAHSSRDARCTLRCKGAKPGQLVTHLAREIIQFKVIEQIEKRPPHVAFTKH